MRGQSLYSISTKIQMLANVEKHPHNVDDITGSRNVGQQNKCPYLAEGCARIPCLSATLEMMNFVQSSSHSEWLLFYPCQ